MKLMGKVLEYSEKDSLGYIEGYDKRVYIFFQNNVKDNIQLKEGNLVEFNFTRDYDDINVLYAIDVEKV